MEIDIYNLSDDLLERVLEDVVYNYISGGDIDSRQYIGNFLIYAEIFSYIFKYDLDRIKGISYKVVKFVRTKEWNLAQYHSSKHKPSL